MHLHATHMQRWTVFSLYLQMSINACMGTPPRAGATGVLSLLLMSHGLQKGREAKVWHLDDNPFGNCPYPWNAHQGRCRFPLVLGGSC